MRLTLDWDRPDEMQENIEKVRRLAERGDGYQLRQSSGGDGFHAIIWGAFSDSAASFRRLTFPQDDSEGMRIAFGDDEKRVGLDRTRWNLGSPFVQVLYNRKYINRSDRHPYQSGNQSEVIEGTVRKSEDEKIKQDNGRLDYRKTLRLVLDEKDMTAADLSEKLGTRQDPAIYSGESGGRSASTIRSYLRGDRDVSSDAVRRWARRNARTEGIGHHVETDDGGKSADMDGSVTVEFADPDHQRRTIVEYIDAPWSGSMDDEDREYALCQVETGTFNADHTEGQHRYAHEKAVNRVKSALSPTSPKNGVKLNLDRDLGRGRGWDQREVRNPDSVHYENEVLDPGEADVYAGNLPAQNRINGDPTTHIITEVLLWDEDMSEVIWHVLLIDDGDDWTDHTVLRDSKNWW